MRALRLLSLVVALAGCQKGTYVLLHVEGDPGASATRLDIDATRDGLRAAASRLGPFALPQTLALEIADGRSGALDLTGTLTLDGGATVQRTTSVQIVTGTTVDATLDFTATPPMPDMATPPPGRFTFDVATSLPMTALSGGNGPQDLAIGDLDGDGHPDAIAALPQAKSLGLYSGGTTRSAPISVTPDAVAIGNFAGGARIAVLDRTSATVTFWSWAAGGPQQVGAPLPIVSGARHLVVARLDGDTIDDVAIDTASSIVVYYTNGAVPTATVSVNNPSAFAFAPLTSGGRNDLVSVSDATGQINVWLNQGTSFASQGLYAGSGLTAMALADMDADGKTDLVGFAGQSANGDLAIYLGDGMGNFALPRSFPSIAGGRIAVGDLDGDGKRDVVVTSGLEVALVLQQAGGAFTLAARCRAGYYSSGPAAIADFDGDGANDALVTNLYSPELSLLRGDGKGRLRAAVGSPVVTPASAAMGDLTGDAKPELVVGSSANNGVSVYPIGADFSLGAPLQVALNAGPQLMRVAPVLGARNDVVTVSPTEVNLLSHDNTGALFRYGTGTLQNPFAGLAVGELDGDGLIEIIVADVPYASVGIYAAAPTLQAGRSFPVPNGISIYGTAAADLDGDGRDEVIVGTSRGVTIRWGGTTTVDAYDTGSYAYWPVALDVDRDGRLDLLVANRDSRTLTFLRQTAPRTFAAPENASLSWSPGELLPVDLSTRPDASGELLLVVHAWEQRRAVLLARRAGQWVETGSFSIGGVGFIAGVRDLDGDGLPELIAVSSDGSFSAIGRGALR